MVSGKVTGIINDANQYRTSIVSRRRGELASYQAKLAQFKSNPDLVVQRDWADAMATLIGIGAFVARQGKAEMTAGIHAAIMLTKLRNHSA